MSEMLSSNISVGASRDGKQLAGVTTDGLEEIELPDALKDFRDHRETIDFVAFSIPWDRNALHAGTEIPTFRYFSAGGWDPI